MNTPNDENKPPAMPVTIKTMFYTEGNPAGLLVENRGGRRSKKLMPFDTAEAVLACCRKHGSNLYYTAINITHG
jgi:hypothetical protein